jgi:hypothetical protein
MGHDYAAALSSAALQYRCGDQYRSAVGSDLGEAGVMVGIAGG